jgi:Domain of unknown function (DUF4126)
VEVLPWIFSSGWASGINGYAVVLLLGLGGRFAGADGVPPALQRTDVLLLFGVLFLLDQVADKVPYLDSAWHVLHTAVQPTIGALVGALLAGQSGDLGQLVGGATGGVTALASHLVRSGLRAAVNTSPEPASNVVASGAEDLTVAGVVGLSMLYPWIAAAIAAVLLAAGALVVVLLWRRVRAGLRRRRARRAAIVARP